MTVTSTVPVPTGAVAVMEEPEEPTVTPVAAVFPKSTVDGEVNPLPVIVTEVPFDPDVGLIAVTVDEYEKFVLAVTTEVPDGVVTVTGTVPVPGGDVAVIEVSLLATKVAVALPK